MHYRVCGPRFRMQMMQLSQKSQVTMVSISIMLSFISLQSYQPKPLLFMNELAVCRAVRFCARSGICHFVVFALLWHISFRDCNLYVSDFYYACDFLEKTFDRVRTQIEFSPAMQGATSATTSDESFSHGRETLYI